MKTVEQRIPIKPYKISDLVRIYGLSRYVIVKLIASHAEIGAADKGYYSIEQVELIFQKLGVPKTIVVV